MASKPNKKATSPVPSEAELKRKHERWMGGISLCQTLGIWAIASCAAWACVHSIFFLPVQVAHGETTTISVFQSMAADVNTSVYVAWGSSAAAVAWGMRERRARLRERKEKDDRIAKLEKHIDPNRSTSGMDPTGEKVIKSPGGQ